VSDTLIPDNLTKVETSRAPDLAVGRGRCQRVYLEDDEVCCPLRALHRGEWADVGATERPRIGYHDGHPVIELPWTWSANSVRVFREEVDA